MICYNSLFLKSKSAKGDNAKKILFFIFIFSLIVLYQLNMFEVTSYNSFRDLFSQSKSAMGDNFKKIELFLFFTRKSIHHPVSAELSMFEAPSYNSFCNIMITIFFKSKSAKGGNSKKIK